jgi:glycosyltransferase involved in cell wall biosynthesis
MILLTHATGNANVRYALDGLIEAGLLAEFWTAASWNPSHPLAHFLPKRLRSQLERRAYPPKVRSFIHQNPWREVGRMVSSQLGWRYPARHESGPFCIDAVFLSLDRAVARRLREPGVIRGVYAFEDGAWAAFAEARKRGVKTIYDLPIGYWRAAHAIYDEEAEREPEWACTLTGREDSREKLARKDDELNAADVVIAASSFTRKTLELASFCKAPVHVIPYGAPPPVGPDSAPSSGGKRLRVLFVGSLGQRKGVSYLLQAVEQVRESVELTLIGRKAAANCRPLNEGLRRHRWIPTLPHHAVLAEMAAHDVLVFPSLFEGFGLVILEAMAQGLPVITTAQTAGPDIIDDGRDGFIVPMRSAAAIAEKLDLLAGNRPLLCAVKAAARETAARFTWSRYQSRLIEAIGSAVPK